MTGEAMSKRAPSAQLTRLSGRGHSSLPKGPFRGRESELQQLEACLETARGGRGSFVAVSGASGIGKSRLLAEFGHLCRERGATVLQSRAIEHAEPYALWKLLVSRL